MDMKIKQPNPEHIKEILKRVIKDLPECEDKNKLLKKLNNESRVGVVNASKGDMSGLFDEESGIRRAER